MSAINEKRVNWRKVAEERGEEINSLRLRVMNIEAGIREHWQESTHGATANMRHADSKLHALIGL